MHAAGFLWLRVNTFCISQLAFWQIFLVLAFTFVNGKTLPGYCSGKRADAQGLTSRGPNLRLTSGFARRKLFRRRVFLP